MFAVGTPDGGGGGSESEGKVEAASFGDGGGGGEGVVSPAANVVGGSGGGTAAMVEGDDGAGGRASVVALSIDGGGGEGEVVGTATARFAAGAVGRGEREVGTWSWPSESWWTGSICAVAVVVWGRRVRVVARKKMKVGMRKGGGVCIAEFESLRGRVGGRGGWEDVGWRGGGCWR